MEKSGFVKTDKPAKRTVAPKRLRRTAEEAKRLILDAAELLMSSEGPGGLRLQDVGAAVGLTHPVILHHFGSRDGLMRALNERILDQLRQRLFAILESDDKPPPDIVDRLLDSVFAVFRGGLAQRLVWLGADAVPADDPPAAIFASFVDGIHQHRCNVLPADPPTQRADTEMLVYLVTVAALGDAVFGGNLVASPNQTFRPWLSRLLQTHLLTGSGEVGGFGAKGQGGFAPLDPPLRAEPLEPDSGR
jgi:AcrR family transcriptional regulator